MTGVREGGQLDPKPFQRVKDPRGKGPYNLYTFPSRDNGKLPAVLEKGCQNPLLIPAKLSRVYWNVLKDPTKME